MLGERLGAYRLLSELGSGGMGRVYKAEDADGVPVAVKVVHPHLLETPGMFKRFLREADVGRQVKHENVVRALDVDATIADGRPLHYIVMEYVEGKSLRELLFELGTVPEILLREVALQAAAGLAAIHEKGIVHRDLKPENILITDDQRIRIMDLGVAKLQEATIEITGEGHFAGSVLYAAPEQFGTEPVGPRADLYALGVALYELATGDNPFRRETVGAVIEAQVRSHPARVGEVNADVTSFFSELVAALIEKDPDRRFESAEALFAVLEQGERSPWWAEVAAKLRKEEARLPRIRVRRDTGLHGRGRELAVLEDAWERAQRGEGNTLFLEGEAGIGKTRLVDAFLRRLPDEEVHVLYGSYPPSGGLGGISDAILDKFGEVDLSGALATYLDVTPALVPAFAALLRHESPPTGSEPLRESSFQAVCTHLMRALAEERPLFWVIEDLQFASKESREAVLAMARAAEGNRVLLLPTARPGLSEDELSHFSRLESHRRLTLDRLGAREVQELLEDAFKSVTLAEKLGGKIAKKSDGVPFFVFEMIRGLRDGEFITKQPDGSYVQAQRITEIEVPSAIRDLVGGRLRGLTEQQRMILDVGAVVGVRFDPGLVAAVLEEKKVRVLQQLAEVERRFGLVHGEAGETRFDQSQIQEVLYSDLTPDLRAEYHSMIADVYAGRLEGEPGPSDAVFLASHHLRGSRPKEALPHLFLALNHLADSHRGEEGVDLAALALERPDLLGVKEKARALLKKAQWHGRRGDRDDERAALDEALERADESGDPALRAAARTSLGAEMNRTSRYEEALPVLEEALSLARQAADRVGEARAMSMLATAQWTLGHADEAIRLYGESRDIAKEVDDLDLLLAAAGNLGNVLMGLGRTKEAHEQYVWLQAAAREAGDRDVEAKVTGSLGNVSWSLGRIDKAIEHYERWRDLARGIGDRLAEARAMTNLGLAYSSLGRLEDAVEHLERSVEVAHEVDDRQGEANALGNLGSICESLGRLGDALGSYGQSRQIARETGDKRAEAAAAVALGSLHATLGDAISGRERLTEALSLLREVGDRRNEGYALLGLGSIAERGGNREEAERLYRDALELERSIPFPLGVVAMLGALGHLETKAGCHDEAAAHLDEALEVGRGMEAMSEVVLVTVLRACLPGGDPAIANAALNDLGAAVGLHTRAQAHFLLWQATGDPSHLEESQRLLCHLRDHAPEEYRESMMEKVPLHRDIARAWREQGGS